MDKGPKGRLGWIDLTVDDADRVRDFYQAGEHGGAAGEARATGEAMRWAIVRDPAGNDLALWDERD